MVYKSVRGGTLGQSLPVLNSVKYLPLLSRVKCLAQEHHAMILVRALTWTTQERSILTMRSPCLCHTDTMKTL